MRMKINHFEVEIFYVQEPGEPYSREMFPEEGFYWWASVTGQLPGCNPHGPFFTELEAQQDAINNVERKVA